LKKFTIAQRSFLTVARLPIACLSRLRFSTRGLSATRSANANANAHNANNYAYATLPEQK